MNFINIPEKIGGDLLKLQGIAEASMAALRLGKSQTGNPKITAEFTCTTELLPDGNGDTSIGAKILDTLSLQEKALFRLENYVKAVNGEGLPKGRQFTEEEFMAFLNETLLGTRWQLELALEADNKGEERTVIKKFTYLGK